MTGHDDVTGCDLVVALGQDALNGLLASLASRPGLRGSLLTGTLEVPAGDRAVPLDWSLGKPPVFSLHEPTGEEWRAAIGPRGVPPRRVAGAFTVLVPELTVSGPGIKRATRSVKMVCTLAARSGMLVFTPLGVEVDLRNVPDPNDRAVYRRIVVPKALQAAPALLAGAALPRIDLAGLSFGDFALATGSGMVVGAANTADRPPARAPDPAVLFPRAPAFEVLLSPSALQRAARTATADLAGRSESTGGSSGFGIGRATYQGRVRVDAAAARVTGHPLDLDVDICLSVHAEAGVDLFPDIGEALTRAAQRIRDLFPW
ncbi:hypothetical protein HZZ00_18620 [Streptomyces sp. NEAU-sy36]|uniref:hypothetical protein n=1 Tax=unclassified Streptomyces TaxID=2593676 RepID=UPI0015D5F93E|nr:MULTISPECIES: hypothetical protein [unclassified Streptomyces]QLJ02829.1 hypothetical protein HZZ00_18620 [Streptomyces sp. NEAU-sy36]